MQERVPAKRRVYLIRDSSQPHIILGIQVIYFLLVFFSGTVLAIVMQHNVSSADVARNLAGRDTLELLLPTLIVLNVVGLIVTSILSVFFTHRIVGPVYRLRYIMRDVGDGNLSRLAAFRKDDELQELATAFDEMVIGLNRRVYRLRAEADAVLEAAGRIPLENQSTGLAHAANQMVADLARFRLMPKEELDARE